MKNKTYYTTAGDSIEKEYVLHDDGRIEVAGTHDLGAEIQSYRDSVDLKRLIDNAVDFDDPRFHQSHGIYMDASVLPKTASAVSDLGKYNKRKISGLPPELRNLSLEDFLALSDTDIVSILDNKNNKNNNKKDNNDNEIKEGENNG